MYIALCEAHFAFSFSVLQRYLSKLREEHDDVKEVVVQLKKDVMKLQKDVEQK